jgi:cellulose synthase/poly-beta-1,6-N-acetylglucosamine synthase-like glycosyltransferase
MVTKFLIELTFVLYFIALTFIFFYSLTQMNLVRIYLKNRRNGKKSISENVKLTSAEAEWPFVTVQLPVFNELYVVERLINSAAAFNYPKNKFEIQILDDSTDETTELIEAKVREYKEKGFYISHVKRSERTGFKAGALANGLTMAKGEFVAIFDADFLPSPDFLLKTLPYFQDKSIGVVQAKWEHINEDYSLLTRLQAFGLDAHFSIEQQGRNSGGYFINFNGTAGVLRRNCILDAGNWHSDTLTEDLDLSYRAQLRGWKCKYLEKVGAPAELPVTMSALKTQQFRWSKGAAECARKNLSPVFKSNDVSGLTKIHALFHLTNSTVFPCIVIAALLSIPLLFIKNNYPQYSEIYLYASFSLFSLLFIGFFYWVSATRVHKIPFISFLKSFFMFLSFSMGFSLHNSVAVLKGYVGKKMPFIRTPKFNISSSKDNWKGKRYLVTGISLTTFLEGLLALYFLTGIFIAFYYNDFGLVPFHIMLSLGFGSVAGYSFWHSKTNIK